jgi:nitroreductase
VDALELLLGRTSALKLAEPAPSAEELDVVLRSAVRAPDHGRLRPWRFVVIQADQRERFGELMADSLRARSSDVSPELLQRERAKAMRAPVIVVVAACVRTDRNIPAIEQIASASAAAQNIMLAAHAQGFGAMWKTGAPAYDTAVKRSLGLADADEIIGFMYLGTRVDGGAPASGPETADHVTVWRGRA